MHINNLMNFRPEWWRFATQGLAPITSFACTVKPMTWAADEELVSTESTVPWPPKSIAWMSPTVHQQESPLCPIQLAALHSISATTESLLSRENALTVWNLMCSAPLALLWPCASLTSKSIRMVGSFCKINKIIKFYSKSRCTIISLIYPTC